MPYEPTKFLETNALLALQDKDYESANSVLSKMTDNELLTLYGTTKRLQKVVSEKLLERTSRNR